MYTHDRALRFSEALISEIKAEMGRRDLSSRALGRAIGKSSQYMSDRLDGGSSKTGERVTINVRDLAAISAALGFSPVELVTRAELVLAKETLAEPISLDTRRNTGRADQTLAPHEEERAVAFEASKLARREDDEEFFS